MKRIIVWFLKQVGNKVPIEEDAWKRAHLWTGFLNPIEDHGEMYAKWLSNYFKRSAEQQEYLNTTICPIIGRSCSRESCAAYRSGYYKKISRDVSITERLIAWIEKRPLKEVYTARSTLASCTKDVF